jgi:DNA-directed RNA polymerase subunit M/transcription elongation factor TFIIS
MNEFAALMGSLKASIEIIKGLKSTYDAHTVSQALSEILERLIALQGAMLSLQEKHSLLIKEKDDLTKKLMELEEGKQVDQLYDLIEIIPGTFVYRFKVSNNSTQPLHYACANCRDDRTRYYKLQGVNTEIGMVYTCHKCNFQFNL